MSEATAPAPVAAPAVAPIASPSPRRTTADDRAAALMQRLSTEEGAPSETAAGVEEQPSTPLDGPGAAAAASEGAPDEPPVELDQRRRERMDRIQQVRAREEADRQRRQQQEQRRAKEQASTGELEQLRAKLKEYEPLNSVFGSEESLLAEAERRGMSAEKLVQWMRTRLSDPAAVAQKHAQTEAEKVRQEMAELKEQIRREREEWQAEQKRIAQERESVDRANEFIERANSLADTHPLSAALLRKYGPRGLVAWANQFVAPLLPEGYSLDVLHDHVEQLLEETQLSGDGRAQAAPANGQATKSGAGQPITTLSNALAGERRTVVEEVPLHNLPLEERVTRLKDRLSRE
jgi:hypothetical protein